MAFSIHAKFTPKVTGESEMAGHKEDIEILHWSWGMTQSGTAQSGTGTSSGKVNVRDLSFTKYVDSASADLMKLCCKGTAVDAVVLTMDKAGGDAGPMPYVTLTLSKCLITSVDCGGNGGADRLTENVTLNFAEFEYQYSKQTDKNAAGAKPKFKYNVREAK